MIFSEIIEKTFVGAGVGVTRPYKSILGADHGIARPYK
jgi:hypothetical protein